MSFPFLGRFQQLGEAVQSLQMLVTVHTQTIKGIAVQAHHSSYGDPVRTPSSPGQGHPRDHADPVHVAPQAWQQPTGVVNPPLFGMSVFRDGTFFAVSLAQLTISRMATTTEAHQKSSAGSGPRTTVAQTVSTSGMASRSASMLRMPRIMFLKLSERSLPKSRRFPSNLEPLTFW